MGYGGPSVSAYENYHQTSPSYDRTRAPVGIEIIIGCLALNPRPLSSQRILDAGCGTGNYAIALLAHVGEVVAMDLNSAMLDIASSKLTDASRRACLTFHRASISALPFEDASFDGITVNQVLHHLPRSGRDGLAAYRQAFREFARVLRPGGALIINTCSIEQLGSGFWYYDLIPDAAAAMRERHLPLEDLGRLLDEAGLAAGGCFVPLDAVLQGAAYFDAHGPLDKHWRDGDSIWSTVPSDRLEDVLVRVRAMERDGTLEAYVADHDAGRRRIGQMTFVSTRRRPGDG